MAISCEPMDVAALARCFLCLDRNERDAVKTYLLAVLAGGSLDPATLLAEAKCFQCIDAETALNLQNYLLCQAVNACAGG